MVRVRILVTEKAYNALKAFIESRGETMEGAPEASRFYGYVALTITERTYARALALRQEGETISDLLIRITKNANQYHS